MTVIDQVRDDQPLTVAGVDVVLNAQGRTQRVLDQRSLKIAGALHRRFWKRRREMLQNQARKGVTRNSIVEHGSMSSCVANVADAVTWDDRLLQFEKVANMGKWTGEEVVAIRGWSDTEPGVLVDGRAVPGSVFDVAIALSLVAEELREGRVPFTLSIPEPQDEAETALWRDLLALAEDRLGVERGIVRVGVLGTQPNQMPSDGLRGPVDVD